MLNDDQGSAFHPHGQRLGSIWCPRCETGVLPVILQAIRKGLDEQEQNRHGVVRDGIWKLIKRRLIASWLSAIYRGIIRPPEPLVIPGEILPLLEHITV
jgi:hypothetical protein